MENKFDKIMHYANFNITFGAENEPMLSYLKILSYLRLTAVINV